jgi:hypothetical protein
MTHQASIIDQIPEPYRGLAGRLATAMTEALEANNKREHGQLRKILDAAATGGRIGVTVYPFWTQRAKRLAAEFEDLRSEMARPTPDAPEHPSEPAPSDDSGSFPALEPQGGLTPAESVSPERTSKPKYREMTFVPGENPFRASSKNARVYELLCAGPHTKAQLADASGADPKSVGYAIWLLKRNGFPLVKDKEAKTYRLDAGVQQCSSGTPEATPEAS